MFAIEFMWTGSLSSFFGYVPYRIYVDKFPIEFMCMFPMEFMWICSL